MSTIPFAILDVVCWREGMVVEYAGCIYIRRLEGEEYAVGHNDESPDKEEIFEHPAPAVERFLQRVREFGSCRSR